MARTTADIAHDIAAFEPDDGEWLALDDLLQELWQSPEPALAMPQLLGVFERFPEDDGAGVGWAIVHGLEALPGYAPLLLQSLARVPSELGVCMVGRLLKGGVATVEGCPLADVLQRLAAEAPSQHLRELAHGFATRPR